MKTRNQRIAEHGENLIGIFGLDTDPVILCRQLYSIERRAHKNAEKYCNGELATEAYERMENRALKTVDDILHFTQSGVPVFINSDPRGYALKINDEYVREHDLKIERDWGGYGIIAPEIQ